MGLFSEPIEMEWEFLCRVANWIRAHDPDCVLIGQLEAKAATKEAHARAWLADVKRQQEEERIMRQHAEEARVW